MSRLGAFPKLVLRATREHIPLDVSLELTNRCNFRCAHCYIPDFDAPDGLSTERILELLDELASMGTLFLALTGGEPLLRDDWAEIARRARELGFHVLLLTNGALIDEAAAALMAELRLQVRVSFHAGDPETFDRVTGRPGSFGRVLDRVRLLVRHEADVELTVPVTSLNRSAPAAVTAVAGRLGVDVAVYTSILPSKDGTLGPLQLRLPGEELTALLDGPATGCHPPEDDDAEILREGPLCAAGVRYAAISASGEVRACTVLPGAAGNLNERSFREIWEGSPWLRSLRSITARDLKGCSTCGKLAYCGRCHALALLEDGDLLGPSKAACEYAAAMERLHVGGS